jgi:hypothetical protein
VKAVERAEEQSGPPHPASLDVLVPFLFLVKTPLGFRRSLFSGALRPLGGPFGLDAPVLGGGAQPPV